VHHKIIIGSYLQRESDPTPESAVLPMLLLGRAQRLDGEKVFQTMCMCNEVTKVEKHADMDRET